MISRWVGRAPVVVFTVLAYALSWWPALLPGGGLLPHGPAVAAGVVIGVTTGRAGLRRWVGSMVAAGRGVRWYAGAALVPTVLALGAAGATVVAGAPVPGAVDWRDPVRVLPLMLVVGGMWEEPG